MELYNEDYRNTTKKSKMPIIIGVSITVLILIMILLIFLIIYLGKMVTKITLNGVDASELEKIFYIDETTEEKKLYIPIRRIAQYFEYEDYRGDYKYKSEDENKCYVKNENEIAMFTLDSNKLIRTRGDSDYEYVDLDENVVKMNGELYTTIDGIKKAFNVEFLYSPEKREIEIYTMDYLINFYTTSITTTTELIEYSNEFTDQKAIFQDMLVIKQNNQYGVIQASTGAPLLEVKYDSVKYLPNTNDFLVSSNNKYGIISKDTTVKVKLNYDEIKIMDNVSGLYMIKQKNLYGVVDINGNIIIQPEYQQIGINIDSFAQNGIENKYIILDELIPIKNNNLWAFFNLKGEQITEFEYTGIGCSSSKVASSYPVLAIPSYRMIVVEKDKLYNLMRTDGTVFVENTFVFDSIYLRTDNATGQNTFYMTFNGNTINVEEYLAGVEKNPT